MSGGSESTASKAQKVLVQLDAELRLPVHLSQVVLKDRFRHVNRGEDVGDQTDCQGDSKATDRPGSKQEEEECRDHRGDVRIDDGEKGLVESGLHR